MFNTTHPSIPQNDNLSRYINETPATWIVSVGAGFVATMLTSYILKKELQKRKGDHILYVSLYFKIFPLLCITAGTLAPLFIMLQYIPSIFCHFSYALGRAFFGAQGVFMGYFQLSRLYYCFAKSQVHSNNGYSNNLFLCMYTIGGLLIIFIVISCVMDNVVGKCGYDSELNFFVVRYFGEFTETSDLRELTCYLIYIVWDLTTLVLCIIKLMKFNKMTINKNKDIEMRTKYILNKIIILTILYEVSALMVVVCVFFDLWILYAVVGNLFFVIMNYSALLMQEHNNEQYIRFLQILKGSKIYIMFCCCKCKSLIDNGLEWELHKLQQFTITEENKNNNMNSMDSSKKDPKMASQHHQNQQSLETAIVYTK